MGRTDGDSPIEKPPVGHRRMLPHADADTTSAVPEVASKDPLAPASEEKQDAGKDDGDKVEPLPTEPAPAEPAPAPDNTTLAKVVERWQRRYHTPKVVAERLYSELDASNIRSYRDAARRANEVANAVHTAYRAGASQVIDTFREVES